MSRRLFLGALAALAFACDPGVQLGTRCDLTSECPADLVCRHERCRVACREARDCGPGLRCVASEGGSMVCTVAAEESCSTSADCPAGLSCALGECRTACTEDSQCTMLGACVEGSCAEPTSGQDAGAPRADAGAADDAAIDAGARACGAPMMCGDGVLQGCATQGQLALLRTIVGSELGELELLEPHEFAPTTIPREGTQLVRPQVAIAGTALGGAPGIGLVAWIDGGATEEERTLAIRRFPLDDLATSTTPMGFDSVRGLRSLALAEDGNSVTGFFVPSTPAAAGDTGAWVTFYAGDMAYVNPLSSGSPPSAGYGRLAIVGGASAMLSTSFDLFGVVREDPPDTSSGSMIYGAVDRGRSEYDYRTISTAAFSADTYLESASGPGNVVVVSSPELSGLAAWQPRRSTPLSMLPGTTVDDLPPIQHLGIAASELAGPPTLALADDTGIAYVVGFPSSDGGARFVRMICPRTADCAVPLTEFARKASVTAGPTEQVRLARVRAGYAYAELASMPEGPRVVHLSFMDESGGDVPGFDPGAPGVAGSLLAPIGGDGSTEVVEDVSIHAVRGGGAVTILVAALIRDEVRRLDRVWIGGLRACESR